MTKQQLFAKYHINEGHKVWQPEIDNWMSVEIYRVMHDGELPPPDDTSTKYILDYLDKSSDPAFFFSHPQAAVSEALVNFVSWYNQNYDNSYSSGIAEGRPGEYLQQLKRENLNG